MSRGYEKRAHELNVARRKLANMLQRGEVHLVDRMGVPIQEGDLVMFNPPHQPLGRIVEIKPVVDPQQPPGLAQAVIQFIIPLTARAGIPMQNIVVVGRPEPEGEQKDAEEPKPESSGLILAE